MQKIFMGSFTTLLSRNSKKYFNNNKEMQLLASDLSFDYLAELDIKNPYNSIAKKLILNHFNGPQLRRAESILNVAKILNADAVINFCHWGCKQSNGGAILLKKVMEKNNIPYLSIDGDGLIGEILMMVNFALD